MYSDDKISEDCTNDSTSTRHDTMNLSSLVLFESDFAHLPMKGKDIEEIFMAYNEYSKDNGFKMRKSINKRDRDLNCEVAVFQCANGRDNDKVRKGPKKLVWKPTTTIYQGMKLPPCRVKIVFERFYSDEWVLKDLICGHNHEQDGTMMSNELIYYIDNYVTSRGCNISAMEIINHLRERYQREFDL